MSPQVLGFRMLGDRRLDRGDLRGTDQRRPIPSDGNDAVGAFTDPKPGWHLANGLANAVAGEHVALFAINAGRAIERGR